MASSHSFIRNSEAVTRVFGRWPAFHDAEVLELNLVRSENVASGRELSPILALKIYAFDFAPGAGADGKFMLYNRAVVSLGVEVVDVRALEAAVA